MENSDMEVQESVTHSFPDPNNAASGDDVSEPDKANNLDNEKGGAAPDRLETTENKITFLHLSRQSLLVNLSFMIFAVLYTWTIVFTGENVFPSGGDFGLELSLPAAIQRSWDFGQYPLWTDSYSFGFPYVALTTNRLAYPLEIVTHILGPVQGIKAGILIHVFLAGAGFWLFSKKLTNNPLARYFGSLVFMLSGTMAARICAGHLIYVYPIPWIPITLFALMSLDEHRNLRYVVMAGISLAMFFLIELMYGLMFSILLGSFFLFKVFPIKGLEMEKEHKQAQTKRLDTSKKSDKGSGFKTPFGWVGFDKQMLMLLAMTGALAIMISAFKLVPVILYNMGITRSIVPLYGSASLSESAGWFLSRNMYVPASDPNGFWEYYSYLGILPLLFVPLGILRSSKHRPFLLLAAFFFMLWVQGYYTLLAPLHMLPLISNFRVPARALIFLSFILISFMVLGVEYAMEKYSSLDEKTRKWLAVGVLMVMLLIGFEIISSMAFPFLKGWGAFAAYYTRFDLKIVQAISLLAACVVTTLMMPLLLGRPIGKLVGKIPALFSPKKLLDTMAGSGKVLVSIVLVLSVATLFWANTPLFKNIERPVDETHDIASDILSFTDEPNYWAEFEPGNFDNLLKNSIEHELIANGVGAGWFGASGVGDWHIKYSPSGLSSGAVWFTTSEYLLSSHPRNSTNLTFVNSYQLDISHDESWLPWIETYGENSSIYLYHYNNSLPDAFVLNGSGISALNLDFVEYSPNEVTLRVANVKAGDKVVLKTTYNKHWMVQVDGKTAVAALDTERMVSYIVGDNEENITLRFFYSSDYFTWGVTLTCLAPVLVALVFVLGRKKGFLKW